MANATSSTLRRILWPTLLTLAVSILRLVGELQGWVNSKSGGAGAWLGITWLVLVFGAWFGLRLRAAGSAPRLQPAWLWSLVPVLLFVGAFAYRMYDYTKGQGFQLTDTSAPAQAHIRTTLYLACAVGGVGMLVTFATWARLAWTLLLYGVVARVAVLAITYVAKVSGWNTHYTKFGPAGAEWELGETMFAATVAQLGMWVPFTVFVGGCVGCLLGGRRRA
ncbi:MAG: hypothetical protein JNK49_10185 [Planctomycetes bacterium]|nr:hypothetical protein [Planctomycetota bacterium]